MTDTCCQHGRGDSRRRAAYGPDFGFRPAHVASRVVPKPPAPFRDQIRDVVQRVCDRRGLSREKLAVALKVHRNALMLAAYKAEIGLELVERLAREAGLTSEELVSLELAWFRARAEKADGKARSRTAAAVENLVAHIEHLEGFLRKKGLLDEALGGARSGGPLRADARRRLRGD